MTNAGSDCDDEYESQLLNAFFAGFRDSLPPELAGKNYCLEVLAHWYHEVDSSEHAYHRVGVASAAWFAKFPDVFHAEVA